MKKIVLLLILLLLSFDIDSEGSYYSPYCEDCPPYARMYINMEDQGGKIIVTFVDCNGHSQKIKVKEETKAFCFDTKYEITIQAIPWDDWELNSWGIDYCEYWWGEYMYIYSCEDIIISPRFTKQIDYYYDYDSDDESCFINTIR